MSPDAVRKQLLRSIESTAGRSAFAAMRTHDQRLLTFAAAQEVVSQLTQQPDGDAERRVVRALSRLAQSASVKPSRSSGLAMEIICLALWTDLRDLHAAIKVHDDEDRWGAVYCALIEAVAALAPRDEHWGSSDLLQHVKRALWREQWHQRGDRPWPPAALADHGDELAATGGHRLVADDLHAAAITLRSEMRAVLGAAGSDLYISVHLEPGGLAAAAERRHMTKGALKKRVWELRTLWRCHVERRDVTCDATR
jgi:hypothetical protein